MSEFRVVKKHEKASRHNGVTVDKNMIRLSKDVTEFFRNASHLIVAIDEEGKRVNLKAGSGVNDEGRKILRRKNTGRIACHLPSSMPRGRYHRIYGKGMTFEHDA